GVILMAPLRECSGCAQVHGPGTSVRSVLGPPGPGDVLADLRTPGGALVGLLAGAAGAGLPQGLLHGGAAHDCLLRSAGFRGLTGADLSGDSSSSVPVCLWRRSPPDCQWRGCLWAAWPTAGTCADRAVTAG